LNTKEDILNHVVNQKVDGNVKLPIYIRSRKKKNTMEVNATVNSILQNIIFCLQQKKLIQVWNYLRVN